MSKSTSNRMSLALACLALAGLSRAEADIHSETVMIPTSVRFGDLAADAGLYRVVATQDGSIELQPTVGGEALRIPAVTSTHSQTIDETIAVAARRGAREVNVVVLSPDGVQRSAVGSPSGATSRATRRMPVAMLEAEVRKTTSRINVARQTQRQMTAASAAATRQELLQQQQATADPGTAPDAEYTFRVPLNLQSLPQSVEEIQLYAMLGTAPFNDNATMGGAGEAVGWGQARVTVPDNGNLQTTFPLAVDWYGSDGTSPFPTHYVVYIQLVPVGGPMPCGSDSAWEAQARCGTPFTRLVTGELPP